MALEVRGLTRAGKFRDVGFQLRRGEILGIAGLMGAGRTELVSAIFGLAPADAGEIRVNGRPVRVTSPRDAIAHGIALVAEDRKVYGLVPRMSVKAESHAGEPEAMLPRPVDRPPPRKQRGGRTNPHLCDQDPRPESNGQLP